MQVQQRLDERRVAQGFGLGGGLERLSPLDDDGVAFFFHMPPEGLRDGVQPVLDEGEEAWKYE